MIQDLVHLHDNNLLLDQLETRREILHEDYEFEDKVRFEKLRTPQELLKIGYDAESSDFLIREENYNKRKEYMDELNVSINHINEFIATLGAIIKKEESFLAMNDLKSREEKIKKDIQEKLNFDPSVTSDDVIYHLQRDVYQKELQEALKSDKDMQNKSLLEEEIIDLKRKKYEMFVRSYILSGWKVLHDHTTDPEK